MYQNICLHQVILKFIENTLTLMGMDWLLVGRTFTHIQKVFKSVGFVFYEMVVVVIKEDNVLVFC